MSTTNLSMDILLTILVVIVIFSVIVLVHEYGHYAAARRLGVKVLEFGIGFPPRLYSKKIGETIYSINAIPFGGFVKLFGEDATNAEAIHNPESFAHKSPWARTKIIVAGVVMNFLLAIVLLTIGFSFGIEPLLVTKDDVLFHLSQKNIRSEPGAFIEKVSENAKNAGLEKGDEILAIDEVPVDTLAQLDVFTTAQKDLDLFVRTPLGSAKKVHLALNPDEKEFGITLKPTLNFPRLTVLEVKAKSASEKAGVQRGDVILEINGTDIYTSHDLDDALIKSFATARVKMLRDHNVITLDVPLADTKKVIITGVQKNSVAQKAGFKENDFLISIDGTALIFPEDAPAILKQNPGKKMKYVVNRGGKEVTIEAQTFPEKNILGVILSEVNSFKNKEISVYPGLVLTSITEIKKVHYGFFTALKQSIKENVRLTGLTIKAFGQTIVGLVSKFAVPDDVGGPVQIAYYTHTFIQEGFFALLRFTALLSLSLAVINVLPIPALDGGRLLFVIIEVIIKRRVSAHWEALVHSIGFLLLLLLIGLITYSDIVKLF